MKIKGRKYSIEGLIFGSICIFCLLSFVLVKTLTNTEEELKENYTYVSYEILTDNVQPVAKTDSQEIIRPYQDSTVTIGKTYYDYQNEQTQEKSITFYKDTYIQNSGVDYISKTVFKINAIQNGEVISITKDDITGTTVKIKHDNNLISVYQSLNDVLVKEKDQVTQGQEIATSGTNAINEDLGNHLHFELYNNNKLIDPEKYLKEKIKE